MRYWEDVTEGEILHCKDVVFDALCIIEYGKNFDPQPFHVDETAAKSSIFGGLVASALHTLSACTRVIAEAQENMAILCGLGLDEVRMLNPVRPGDVLKIEARWECLAVSRNKSDRGTASLKCRVINQKNEPVVTYGYRYLIARRKPSTR